MKRIVLFSAPTESNIDDLLAKIFPKEMKNKILAYMPSDGSNILPEFTELWKKYANKNQTDFLLINNSTVDSTEESKKLLSANILVITGGNTFKLLDNLRKSGLDKTVQEFAKKDNFVIAGFSAGALVLTPTIEICNLPNFDENTVGLKDLTGLGIIDFEVFPHFDEDKYRTVFDSYQLNAKHEVKEIIDEDMVIIDL